MYGTKDYLAYLGYAAMRLFQEEIIRAMATFAPGKNNLAVPCRHKYCMVPKKNRYL